MWYGIVVRHGGHEGIISAPSMYKLYPTEAELKRSIQNTIHCYEHLSHWSRLNPRLLYLGNDNNFAAFELSTLILYENNKYAVYKEFYIGEKPMGMYAFKPGVMNLYKFQRIPLTHTVTLHPSESLYDPIRAAAASDKNHERLFRFK